MVWVVLWLVGFLGSILLFISDFLSQGSKCFEFLFITCKFDVLYSVMGGSVYFLRFSLIDFWIDLSE